MGCNPAYLSGKKSKEEVEQFYNLVQIGRGDERVVSFGVGGEEGVDNLEAPVRSVPVGSSEVASSQDSRGKQEARVCAQSSPGFRPKLCCGFSPLLIVF